MSSRDSTKTDQIINWLGYDPGVLPTRPPPRSGDVLRLALDGLPPYKDIHFSIRNPLHKMHNRFVELRVAAIAAMAGQAPYRGAVKLSLTVQCSAFDGQRTLLDYASGILDTLDGSHGMSFTYLPVIYEDDCQVAVARHRFLKRRHAMYQIGVKFL